MQHSNTDFNNQDESFCFSYKNVIGHYTMPDSHFHDKYELYYLLSGNRYYFIKDRTFEVEKGSLILIKPFELHKTIDTGIKNHERVLMKFSKAFVSNSQELDNVLSDLFETTPGIIKFLPTEQHYIETMLFKMIHEIHNKDCGFQVYLQALLMELLVDVKRYIKEVDVDMDEHQNIMHGKISEVIQYINSNYHEPLSLSYIAKKFFISQYYLSRSFKQATGFSFTEYINSVRVREAQILLRETDSKIIRIAEKVGFGNISHFGRIFKNVTGFSPSYYRKLNKIH